MLQTIKDIELKDKIVLLRADLNVPIVEGVISNSARIKAVIPTIKYLLHKGAGVIVVSHLGRPKRVEDFSKYSLAPIALELEQLLDTKVKFVSDWINGVEIRHHEVALCENVRFFEGETTNDLTLAKKMAELCDVFVMDAFGSAHRAHASTVGITKFVKEKAAGLLLAEEVSSLEKFLQAPKKPVLAIVGGAKVSSKLEVLKNIIPKVDFLILGGGIANTFLKAEGHNVGSSLVEDDLIDSAIELIAIAKKNNTEILQPIDVVVAEEISTKAKAATKSITDITVTDKILDIGVQTAKKYSEYINKSSTILWNGPVGVFEITKFANGTKELANAVANNTQAFSIVGGGDTIAALEDFNLADKISYISTGGGAFLEFIEGKDLPAIAALKT